MKRRGKMWAFLLVGLFSVAGLAGLTGLIGCGDGEDNGGGGGGGASKGKVAFPADKATATIQGKINFKGAAPPRKEIRQVADNPKCAMLHKDTKVRDETLVVNANKTVRDVFVQIKKFPADWDFSKMVPKNPASLDQKGCIYVPHMLGLMTGQKLKITSADGFDHNVHFVGKRNKKRNQPMKKGEKFTWRFKQPEFTTIKCDIHSWMKTQVCIVRHPFFAVTGEDGTFEIKGLPPGKYTLEIWHAKLGTRTLEVELEANKTTPADFTLGTAGG